MSSEFLSKIGLGNIDVGYLFLIIFILVIILIGGVGYIIYENMIVGVVRFKIPYVGLPTVWLNRLREE